MASFPTIHAPKGCHEEGVSVLAAVTRSPGEMVIEDVSGPGRARAGHVIVRPEAVGICGSDFHLFSGDVGALSGARDFYPRVQGHEVSAVVEDAGDTSSVREGDRVAIWPLLPCGRCYPCRNKRPNVCVRFRLVGVHLDGGLAERLEVPAGLVFAVGDLDPDGASFVEPASVAVHALARGRLVAAAGRVVVVGMSSGTARLRPGAFPEKEIDVIGSSCATAEDFRDAIKLVAANRAAISELFSHHFPLARAAEAFEFAMSRPPDAIKIVVTVN
jgi:threonine dehydrogenase-like Zn-dependent dehydrogenase